VLYFLREKTRNEKDFIEKNLDDICASVQHTIVKILLDKIHKASVQTGIKEIAIAGGVSANSGLRKAFTEAGDIYGWNTYIPPFEFCTDNGAMVAIAGYYKFLKGEFATQEIAATAQYRF
jgi:N6-L-threonylcarbamoyladenine synthase